jgi:HEAT repeat protein
MLRNIAKLLVCLIVLLWAQTALGAKKPLFALSKLRDQCIAILEETSRDENSYVRSASARAVGESENPALIPLLQKAAEDVYHNTRLFALQGMKNISTKEAVSLAEKLKDDTNVWVKAAAIEMLGDLGGPQYKEQIRPYLQSDDPAVRLSASAALIKMGETDKYEYLLEPLKRSDSVYIYHAIGYLGKIGSKEARSYLIPLLDNAEVEIVFYGLKAIGANVRSDMIPRLTELSRSPNPSIRHQAALELGKLPSHFTRDRLKQLCNDTDGMVRIASAVALKRFNQTACDGVFAEVLVDPDFGIRSAAARALGETFLSDRVQLLAKAAQDTNTRVRTAATRAIGMMGGSEAFPLLIQLLNDENMAVRAYAAGNLLRILK